MGDSEKLSVDLVADRVLNFSVSATPESTLEIFINDPDRALNPEDTIKITLGEKRSQPDFLGFYESSIELFKNSKSVARVAVPHGLKVLTHTLTDFQVVIINDTTIARIIYFAKNC